MLDSPTSELLAIILLPVSIGFCWLVVATILRGPCVADLRESSAKRFVVFSITDAFDADHVIVWQSQAPALRLIGSGVPVSALFQFFARFSLRYPELFEGITFDEWLRLLQDYDLVARVGRDVNLTSSGRSFLEYIERTSNASRAKHPVR